MTHPPPPPIRAASPDSRLRFFIFISGAVASAPLSIPRCAQFVGPDREERVTLTVPDKYCDHCTYWYQSKGRRQ